MEKFRPSQVGQDTMVDSPRISQVRDSLERSVALESRVTAGKGLICHATIGLAPSAGRISSLGADFYLVHG
jgi:hypothetical protein